MFDSFKERIKEGRVAYSAPKSVQDTIPIQRIITNDGLFLCDNRYTKSYKFTDINYKLANYETRLEICTKWSEIINSLDAQAITKITIYNRPFDVRDLGTGIFLETEDANGLQNQVVSEVNSIIRNATEHSSGMIQEKYITVSIARKSVQDAIRFFERLGSDLAISMQDLGSRIEPMTTNERLFVLHSFFNKGAEYKCYFDVTSPYFGTDYKNYIAPNNIVTKREHMIVNNDNYIRTFYLISYPATLNDDMISAITETSENMMLSMDLLPVPIEEAKKDLSKISRGIEDQMSSWQRKHSKEGDFSALPSPALLDKRDGCRSWNDDLNNDERMILTCLTISLFADSKEELDMNSDSLTSLIRSLSGSSAVLDVATFQQKDVLDTCLPYGCWRVLQCRTMNSSSVSVMVPFKVRDIYDPNGICLGINSISKNLVAPDIEKLLNQSIITLGKPGAGKSMLIKWIQIQRLFKNKHRYIVVDPEGEYPQYLQELFPNDVAVVKLTTGSQTKINCMELNEYYSINTESDPVAAKSFFVLSLLSQADPIHPISLAEKSLIDRCVRNLYSRLDVTPTLAALRDEIAMQVEPEAKNLALRLEIFTSGSLNMFGQESNVDLYNSRIIVFDLYGMSEQLRSTALLVLTDSIINMVNHNWRQSEITYIDFDEYHVLFKNPSTSEFFDGAYRQWRKRLGRPNAITQNVTSVLGNTQATSMLSNSEMILMLSQSERDQLSLQELYGLSEEQMKWIKKNKPGYGLLKYGDSFIPFELAIPESTTIYKLLSTKRNEGIFGGRA